MASNGSGRGNLLKSGSSSSGGFTQIGVVNESVKEQKMNVTAFNHPDSPFAGAIGAALWGAFRHEKLARLGGQQLAAAA